MHNLLNIKHFLIWCFMLISVFFHLHQMNKHSQQKGVLPQTCCFNTVKQKKRLHKVTLYILYYIYYPKHKCVNEE